MKDTQERFWSKVDRRPASSCWLWAAHVQRAGYGTFWLNGRHEQAHRVSYAMCVGLIPDGMEIDHTCHVRHCVNPAHLRLATRKQNNENLPLVGRATSGIRGVSWKAASQKWQVRVRHNDVLHYGGLFQSLADAEAAAIRLRNSLFTHNDADRAA